MPGTASPAIGLPPSRANGPAGEPRATLLSRTGTYRTVAGPTSKGPRRRFGTALHHDGVVTRPRASRTDARVHHPSGSDGGPR